MVAAGKRAGCALVFVLALAAVAAPAASAGQLGNASAVQSLAGGAKRVTYKLGPFDIRPGQNPIDYAPITQRPQVDGYITRFKPNLTYLDGTIPPVDVIHLHHAVWVNMSRQGVNSKFPAELFFAAGEEKTIGTLP